MDYTDDSCMDRVPWSRGDLSQPLNCAGKANSIIAILIDTQGCRITSDVNGNFSYIYSANPGQGCWESTLICQ
jgi:hypothetical protein